VIIDDKEPKKDKTKKDSSRLRRLLSLSRRDPEQNNAVDGPPAVAEVRPRMRSLRSNRRTPEAKRNENTRRSFD